MLMLPGWRVKVSICTPTIHSLNHNSGARLLHQWSPNGGWQNRRQGVRLTVRLPQTIVRILTRVPSCSISVPRMIVRLIVITPQIITRVPVCSINVRLWTPRVLHTPWTQFAHIGSSATRFVGTGWHRAWWMLSKTGENQFTQSLG